MTKTSEEAARSHDKPCTLCDTPRPVLVRCQIDETGKWHFVCPGKCWTSVSGGEIDAKGHKEEHPYYRYGGMWKNRHDDGPLNAKKPKKARSKKQKEQQHGKPTEPDLAESASDGDHAEGSLSREEQYTANDGSH